MLENIGVFVTDEVEKRPRGQEPETGGRELVAVLADEHLVELYL